MLKTGGQLCHCRARYSGYEKLKRKRSSRSDSSESKLDERERRGD